MAAFDFKKECRDLYSPPADPVLITVPPMQFLEVEGRGDPNEEGGAYASALGLLYALAYTIKMSDKGGPPIEGYFPYVVPPLEGLWWMADGAPGVDYGNKAGFCWCALLRQPDFVTREVFDWACGEVRRKKKLDPSGAKLARCDEGLCVQCLHQGPYDSEPETVLKMERFLEENGYREDLSSTRRHHEIYLTDPRRTVPEKLRTVLRHPVAEK